MSATSPSCLRPDRVARKDKTESVEGGNRTQLKENIAYDSGRADYEKEGNTALAGSERVEP
jgi:hypothetical protein